MYVVKTHDILWHTIFTATRPSQCRTWVGQSCTQNIVQTQRYCVDWTWLISRVVFHDPLNLISVTWTPDHFTALFVLNCEAEPAGWGYSSEARYETY